MTLGTGLFLSASVLAVAILVATNKIPWNWRRILAWTVLPVIALIVLTFSGNLLYDWIQKRPRPIDDYMGIHLGTSKDDVLFLLGEPKRKEKNKNTDHWEYSDEGKELVVYFNSDKADSLLCSGDRCPSVFEISAGNSSEEIVKRLGAPSDVVPLGSLSRAYNYDRYNVAYFLTKNRVTDIIINRQSSGKKDSPTAPETEESKKRDKVGMDREIDRELERRKKIYSFLLNSGDAKEIRNRLSSGKLSKSEARTSLNKILPKELGSLPPGSEDGDWAQTLERFEKASVGKAPN